MSDKVTNVEVEAGYLVISKDSGPAYRIGIAQMLRAADIPALTYSQVASIKALVNLVVILVRTLISRQILDEDFEDDAGLSISLDGIIEAIEAMGGSYHEPGLEDTDA